MSRRGVRPLVFLSCLAAASATSAGFTARWCQTEKAQTVTRTIVVPKDEPNSASARLLPYAEGAIKAIEADHKVRVALIANEGIQKGHTLTVFRLSPRSEYLGKVQIIEVSPHEAVGKMLDSRLAKQVQVGDKVASRIVK